ncbi:MAG TPA: DUF2269 family protein [Candidatus Limnocylindria bacterium]|nr:DUF2269 family protein [Candidatus Limnocylindria bacterium]
MYEWIVLLHVIGAFIFVAAHGVSMISAFRLRSERDRARQAVLLETSVIGVYAMYVGLLVLLVGGIWAGFAGDHWGRLWIWVALATLVVVIAVMYAVATPFYGRMRAAAGVPGFVERADRYKPPATEADLAMLASSNRPMILAVIGGVGLLVLVWLMVMKPF